MILLGTLLLALPVSHAPGAEIGLIDALFTATSATAVTGLVVVGTGSDYSLFGQMVIMTLIQIGGVGLMVSVTIFAVLFGWRIGLRHRVLVEMDLNQPTMRGVVRLSLRVLLFTIALEGIGAVLLYSVLQHTLSPGQAAIYAVFHSISAFCNAGFDLFGDSLVGFVNNPTVNLTIAALFIVGGLGFTVLQDIAQNKRWSRLSFHSQVVVSMSLILTITTFLTVFLVESTNPSTLGSMSYPERLLPAFFQSVTTRTAGFNTVPIGSLATPTLFMFLIMMFIGASPGSTAGGIKTTTVAAFGAILFSAIRRKKDVELGRFRIIRASLDGALVVVLGAAIWVLVVTFLLLITERAELMPTLFEVVSAIGTVGLSMGLTGDLSELGKLLIVLTMFVGRVGPLALVLSLGQREPQGLARRPEKRLIVG